MEGGPKDNANPLIREIDNKRGSRKKELIGWKEIEDLSASQDIENAFVEDGGLYRSSVDRAVLLALADISAATRGEGVSLLKKVGLVIPVDSSKSESHLKSSLAFVPSKRSASPSHNRMDIDGDGGEVRRDKLDADEIFEIIRNIQDPEHPLTLEQLGVVSPEQIEVVDVLDCKGKEFSTLKIRFTPTVPHCSMATLIGLSIRVKLLRSLPPRFKISIHIEPGTHQSEKSVNKQLADKERVCAALENPHLLKVVNRCIRNGMTGP